jgi:hypothetical protein
MPSPRKTYYECSERDEQMGLFNERPRSLTEQKRDPWGGNRPEARWQKPRILSREPIEAVAATCGPPGKVAVPPCVFDKS